MNILEKLILNKIGVSNGNLTYTDDGVIYTYQENTVNLNCGKIDLGDYRMDEFSFVLVRARDHLERQSKLLTYQDGEKIGWIFPLNALIDRSNIPDNQWASLYASFAINAAITHPSITNHIIIPELIGDGNFSLLDFYSSEYAIIVLSNQSLDKLQLNLNCIALSLMHEGYLTLKNNIKFENAILRIGHDFDTESTRVKINSISKDVENHVENLTNIYLPAMFETNPCLSYFTLYQTIELLLLKVFETTINVYSQSESIKKNPWLMKEKFTQAASEKWRLDSLINRFMKPTIRQDLILDLKQKCDNLLINNKLIDTATKSLALSIYLVRNAVVHRQMEILEGTYHIFREVNLAFYSLCYEIINKFNLSIGEENLIKSIEQGQFEITEE